MSTYLLFDENERSNMTGK